MNSYLRTRSFCIFRALAMLALVAAVTACSTRRDITILTKPGDAVITIDGEVQETNPVQQRFRFRPAEKTFLIGATRKGYQDAAVRINRDFTAETLVLDMKPASKRLTFVVSPTSAVISIDGQPLSLDRQTQYATDVVFEVDDEDNWKARTVKAERSGFAPAVDTVQYEDSRTLYRLVMQPAEQALAITSNPPGAEVKLDGEVIGVTPLNHKIRFRFDSVAEKFQPSRLSFSKPGYNPLEIPINQDDASSTYAVNLPVKTKTISIMVDPPGAEVSIDGKKLKADPGNPKMVSAKLLFPPVAEDGTLKTYEAVVRKGAETEWYPQKLTIAWDEGKSDYSVTLKEVLITEAPLLVAQVVAKNDGWVVEPKTLKTVAMKSTREPPNQPAPELMFAAPAGAYIDTMALSPDGLKMVYSVLRLDKDSKQLRSQIAIRRTDGRGGIQRLTDFASLDLHPRFSPDGKSVIFSSNRSSKNMQIWQIIFNEPGTRRLVRSDHIELEPTIDQTNPQNPQIYHSSYEVNKKTSHIYRTDPTATTDLLSGGQPRLDAKSESLLYTVVNERTGKRDIYRFKFADSSAANLTDAPNSNDVDPAWNADATMIAFSSDRSVDAEGHRHRDIWLIDLSKPELRQMTSNGSWDDQPLFSPDGRTMFYRSNRGGKWGVWKIKIK